MRTIIHLDGDAFFASVAQSFNPLLAGKPVVVGGLPHQRGCVHSASYEARRKGVTVGMGLSKAKELCPDAFFVKGDFRHYRAVGLAIEDILHSFSPDVEIASLDDAYVDLTNVMERRRFPVETCINIARSIRERVNIPVSIGVASSKLVARIASGLNKPSGITSVPHGMERTFLSGLPLRMLRGIGRKTEQVFFDLGITTIGQITTLPRYTVMQLLGSAAGETIWQYAHGHDVRPVHAHRIAHQISRETSFEEDTNDEKLVTGTLRYLSERIADKLRKESWSARQVYVKVCYSDSRSARQSSSLRQPTCEGAVIARRVQQIYDGFPHRRIRIKLVGVKVMNIDYRDRQLSVLDSIESSEQLCRTIDDVRRRFGFSTIAPGSTLVLKNYYRMEKHGYILHTPSLSQ
ncbi:DNA polymerase IV [candidate division KSB1 bacterium]|nr:DNA polymerase IV [candidate division KSB1 bacterium]